MDFTEEETNMMIESYDVMAEVAAEKGVDAWVRYAVGVSTYEAPISSTCDLT
jgi:hypothetical protein